PERNVRVLRSFRGKLLPGSQVAVLLWKHSTSSVSTPGPAGIDRELRQAHTDPPPMFSPHTPPGGEDGAREHGSGVPDGRPDHSQSTPRQHRTPSCRRVEKRPTAMTSLNAPSFYDTASFTLPPKVAKMDAVRKLADRLTAVTGIGDTAASVISHAAVDPAAVRATLAEPLPGLTAHPESHLRVIPARVWTPWLTAPADDIPRYRSKKRLPVSDPSVQATPRLDESPTGLALAWKSQTDRAHHEEDNRRLYEEDIYTDRLRIFPGKGGILTPLVLVPQTETFEDGDLTQPPSSPLMRLSDDGQKLALHTLRIGDGRRRFYEVQDVLRQFARLDEAGLRAHFGRDMTPEVFQEAIQGDRDALAEVVNAIRDACISAGHEGEQQQYIGVHYLASVISMPAYIAVGTVDPDACEFRPHGTDTGYPTGTRYTLETGLTAWHTGKEARVVATGQKEYNGLLLPEGSVDETMVEVAVTRLRARG